MSRKSWEDRRILVTGATGLVGSWLIKELVKRKVTIVAFVRDIDFKTEFFRSGDYKHAIVINGRLEDYSTILRAINEQEIDTIFHLGAQTIVGAAHRDPLQTFESNIRGTYHLLEACRHNERFIECIVVASSDKAYGIAKKLPYTEEMPLNGSHPYDVSKSCTDLLSQTYYHSYDLPITITRCGNIYGGGDLNWSRIVPGTIKSLFKDQKPIIRSDGKYIRDYIYVKDIVNGCIRLSESIKNPKVLGEAFNFSNEKEVTVLEIVNEIRSIMGKNDLEPKILNLNLKEIPAQSLSAEKAHKILGWDPEFNLTQGLTETVEWYKAYFGANKQNG